ncbi:MAG: TVP38/TMEM64 family protein [Ruminococcaceae bacterium]|nr:TVP38/TMEM64 family protein [Oscillospiraceae bacterium]
MSQKGEKVKQMFADKEIEDRGHYTKKKAALIISVISIVMCVLTVVGIIILGKLQRELDENLVRSVTSKYPVASALVMVVLCAVQVIIAFIPGEVVEIAAGYAFGPLWGAVLCIIGSTLGSIIAILLARRFGRKLVESFYSREKLESLPIINNHKKRNFFVVLLFLIPGTPKDLITYIIGLTEMSIPLYLLLTTLCRFPSIITSTLSGGAIGNQNFKRAILFLMITAVVSGIGYLVYKKIQKSGHNKDKSGESK